MPARHAIASGYEVRCAGHYGELGVRLSVRMYMRMRAYTYTCRLRVYGRPCLSRPPMRPNAGFALEGPTTLGCRFV